MPAFVQNLAPGILARRVIVAILAYDHAVYVYRHTSGIFPFYSNYFLYFLSDSLV